MASANAARSAIVVGGSGRMGRLVREALLDAGFDVTGSYDVDNIDSLDEVAPAADLIVDFSAPAALPHVAAYVRRTGAALVSGATGYTPEQLDELRALGEKNRVVWSSNYSLGVAALRHATRLVADALPGWDVEIVETHHNQKADAPSGTAKALLAAVDPAGERPVVSGREGIVGARVLGEIGMHAVRGGTVAGTHEVHFFGTDEEVCLTHRAASRQIFVSGAVAAATRLLGRPAGYYDFDTLMFA
ncbi:4-hydroxy-tetrahydrodipicolinate reductase [Thermophilibacter provencensis]|uniref:4-hydroxy-tetrahydrodipicolinate reductase n=1 Tax=Thermophilibacter provencensis TaxID=1852386 RepID=A0ABT7V370_9ACTN|nr:4-hydroxy-tetrahydrodipicolinate reductase [Thermophilibacter provencensis]MDM8270444.1 4-hydroxy-tetrahydrodipicolinate reductase [Thermophilibacter provencensis]